MSSPKTVLVTGATGFIGRATLSALTDAGWQVTCGSRSGSEAVGRGIVYLDLAAPETILALAKSSRFDAIVHLGASIGWSGATEAEMFVPNVLSTGCLAYLSGLWSSHLIYASAAIVHGVRSESIDSDSPICTDTAYARSKWLGEQLLESSGVKHCSLRIAGVFGGNGPVHLGLNRAIAGVLEGEPPVQIGYGAALRNYVYVRDVARAIVHVLQEGMTGTHLLAGHESMTVGEMLRQVCDVLAPGLQPVVKTGDEASNQIVTPSALLPKTRAFRDALADIQAGYRQ